MWYLFYQFYWQQQNINKICDVEYGDVYLSVGSLPIFSQGEGEMCILRDTCHISEAVSQPIGSKLCGFNTIRCYKN